MMSLAINCGVDTLFAARNPSTVDRSFVVRRLLKNAISLVSSHPRAEYVGPDELVESVSRSTGFTGDDLAILCVCIGATRYTLICAPETVWHARKLDLLELKSMAAFAGRTCILVPERAVQRQPRLGTARAIENAFGVSVTLDQRMAVLLHLIEAGGSSSFMDCAFAIQHPEPFSATLHLVAIGILRLEANAGLTPHTKVYLVSGSDD